MSQQQVPAARGSPEEDAQEISVTAGTQPDADPGGLFAFHDASSSSRAARWLWRCGCVCTVSWRLLALEVVHRSRAGHGPQSSAEKVITMVGVPRWVTGFHERLVRPCGQIACPASKSMVNAVRSYPAPALACAEVSASIGVTSVIP